MFDILGNRTYRQLFLAQLFSLLGSGLATVALGLLAYQLAGDEAGLVLGTALAIKMLAYVLIAPLATALAERAPRGRVLVMLDLLRVGVALMLPLVTQVWQVYLLIFLLQAASAAFTPLFQATIPEVLPDEQAYTRALSLSRLAYDLESVASPLLAAALLSLVAFHDLFAGTALGFLASAALVLSSRLPVACARAEGGLYSRTTRGLRIYLATPRLRGLLALNLAIAAAGSMVIVNTVVLVQARLGLSERASALALALFGAGSMIAALSLPRLLERLPERGVMLAGAALLAICLLAGLVLPLSYGLLLAWWLLIGAGYCAVQTPTGRVLRRSAQAADLPLLFAAQFALSHACWLVTYPLAGWLGARFGLAAAFGALGVIATLALLAAARLWPARDPRVLEHVHVGLDDHPHVAGAIRCEQGLRHSHDYVIDSRHPAWPRW
ncbi:MFS transporter [Stutzerimonas kirkiae]|uniref:MFS transporter n=1 Tax=Stutzerimonas kirkiae TaxID=2211392 RepID=A0A4Q9QY39_9GAMM|nr:MFS transporter [Stutzerimonas kirkiae]TBU90069.1 MFS transporter [Stutzerimonas kirkiae]TBU99071.1 MFS transporter [Stutzerimonas kirkiae]TBV10194.1 MFS transporter [Stutzerimonas kirkiae]